MVSVQLSNRLCWINLFNICPSCIEKLLLLSYLLIHVGLKTDKRGAGEPGGSGEGGGAAEGGTRGDEARHTGPDSRHQPSRHQQPRPPSQLTSQTGLILPSRLLMKNERPSFILLPLYYLSGCQRFDLS